jgi:DNA-binding transcriptional LysR family regulator
VNIKRLQALRAVIELGSITEAAQILNLTQPGVSRHISALEEDLGFLLFNRTRGRLRVTERGKAFFEAVEPLLIGLDKIPSIADEIRQHRHSRLRLVTLNSQAHGLVPWVLERFAAVHPDTAVSITVLSRRELVHWADGDFFDLALAALPLEQRQFQQKTFVRFPVVVALPADHRLCRKKEIGAADLAGENLISLDPFAIFQPGVRARFQDVGVEPVTKTQTTSMLLACQMVSRGLGIAIIDPFIAHALGANGIEYRPFVPFLEYEYAYIWPANRTLSPLAKSFALELTEVAETISAAWRA